MLFNLITVMPRSIRDAISAAVDDTDPEIVDAREESSISFFTSINIPQICIQAEAPHHRILLRRLDNRSGRVRYQCEERVGRHHGNQQRFAESHRRRGDMRVMNWAKDLFWDKS